MLGAGEGDEIELDETDNNGTPHRVLIESIDKSEPRVADKMLRKRRRLKRQRPSAASSRNKPRVAGATSNEKLALAYVPAISITGALP